MYLHQLLTPLLLLSPLVSAGYFSNIFTTAKDTLQGKNIFKSVSENVIETIQGNELQAGLFVCNLFAGNPGAAALVLGQTVQSELVSDLNSLASLIDTLPKLAAADWAAVTSGADNAVAIVEAVITAPAKVLPSIATAAWGKLTNGIGCAVHQCTSASPPAWMQMSSSCDGIFAARTATKLVSVVTTSTAAAGATTLVTLRTGVTTTTLPSATANVVVVVVLPKSTTATSSLLRSSSTSSMSTLMRKSSSTTSTSATSTSTSTLTVIRVSTSSSISRLSSTSTSSVVSMTTTASPLIASTTTRTTVVVQPATTMSVSSSSAAASVSPSAYVPGNGADSSRLTGNSIVALVIVLAVAVGMCCL